MSDLTETNNDVCMTSNTCNCIFNVYGLMDYQTQLDYYAGIQKNSEEDVNFINKLIM